MTGSAASVPRTARRSSARCSSLITSSPTCTEVTPGTAETAWVTRLVIVSRIGQPATVRYTSTRTVPSAPICTSLTMPSSVSGRLISGSWTVARAAFTASSAGEPVSVSDMTALSPSTGGPGAAAGLTTLQALALAALMFTGASQFALVGVLGAGGSALAALGTALLLGTRKTDYGVRMEPLLAPRG